MLKRIPIETSIGRKNREKLVPGYGKAVAEKGASLEWDDAHFRLEKAEELSAARQDQEGARQPWHSDQRANYWQSYMLEELLEREQFASDDDGGPLIPLATMMLMAQAVD
jgi:hypothetical protein